MLISFRSIQTHPEMFYTLSGHWPIKLTHTINHTSLKFAKRLDLMSIILIMTTLMTMIRRRRKRRSSNNNSTECRWKFLEVMDVTA